MYDIVTTPSSDDTIDFDVRRKCSMCLGRMSSIKHDKHSLCVICRGGECTLGNKVRSVFTGLRMSLSNI